VQITGTGSCLNLRWEPLIPTTQPDGTTYANVINCLPDGFIGRLDASGGGRATIPVLESGRWWWHILGQGWAAEEWLTFHHQSGIPWPGRPDLANAGLIAYIGADNGLWVVNADGGNARPLLGWDPNRWVQSVRWSPLGDHLAISIGRTDGTQATLVVDVNGTVISEIAGLAEQNWSPSAGHLAGVKQTPNGAGGFQATPIVLDLATGAESAIGPATYSYPAPVWSPDGSSLAFICTSGYVTLPDGTVVIEEGRDCHGDGLRVVSADGSNPRVLLPTGPQGDGGYLFGPAWSPSGTTIAITSMRPGSCNGYALVDVASAAVTACVSPPGMESFVGGGCGGPGMSAATWAADGRLVFSAPAAGHSGLFVHDAGSGAQTFIPTMSTSQISVTSDGMNLTFGSGGFIWVAGLDGSNLTLLAEGHSPAWQPLP
jgi:WD40 repeat protein